MFLITRKIVTIILTLTLFSVGGVTKVYGGCETCYACGKMNCTCNKSMCDNECSCKGKCTCCNKCTCGCKYKCCKKICAEKLKSKMEKNPGLMIINVLDKKYYDDCHIKGTINVPVNELKMNAKSWDKNKEIILYCASYKCPKSMEAYKILKKLGFKKTHLYEGGMKEWVEKGFPKEGSCKMDYLTE